MHVDKRLRHWLYLRVIQGFGHRIIRLLLGLELDMLVKLILYLHQLFQIVFLEHVLGRFMLMVVRSIRRRFNVREAHDLAHVNLVLDELQQRWNFGP